MAQTQQIKPRLNAGELSPFLEGGVDFDQYPKGLSKCQNFITLVQGPIVKRPGTKFVAEVKDSSKTVNIKEFIFADDDAFILEFGDQYVRFYANHGQVESSPGVPLEVATPYVLADIPLLRFAQSGDIIYIAHSLYAPRKLSRLSTTSWTLATVNFINGPMGIENVTTTTITASATTGSVTLTSSAALFVSDMIGSFVQLRHEDNGGLPAWEAGKAVAINLVVTNDSKTYKALNVGTTGGDQPIHDEGNKWDGIDVTSNVEWQFLHKGFGFAEITAFTDTTNVTATVTSRLPDDVVTNNTVNWTLGDWSSARGYPAAVTFHGDRLFFGGSPLQPQTVWGSIVGDYENYEPGVEDDSSISLTLSSSDVSNIRWMESDDKGLIIGTTRGEWLVKPSRQNEALTPFNLNANRVSNYGSNFVAPVRARRAVLYIQNASRKLRELAYTIQVDGFSAPDMTVRAEHITIGGVTSLAYQPQPNPIIWGTRVDGALLGFTYERDQEVLAWHRHVIGGFSDAARTIAAIAEDVAVIPSPTGDIDEAWVVVQRYIDGGVKRYIEYVTPVFDHDTAQDQAFFVDSGGEYSGVPATVISNLDHLEGEPVDILSDGAVHPSKTVSSGSITLDEPGEEVKVGLQYNAIATTERLEVATGTGSAQGQPQRVAHVVFRVYRTGVFKFGYNEDNLEEFDLRDSEDPMGFAPALISADIRPTWNAPWSTGSQITLVSDEPTPANILAIVPTLEVNPR